MTYHRRGLWLLAGMFSLFLCLSTSASAAPRRGLSFLLGGAKTPGPIQLTGYVLMPRPKQTLQRVMKYRSLGMTPATRRNLQRFLLLLPKFLPQFKAKNLDEALEKFPTLLHQLGVDTQRPLGVLAWDFSGTPYAVASLGIQPSVLKANLRRLGLFQLEEKSLGQGITSYSIVLNLRRGSFRLTKRYFLGLVKQNQLYVLLPYKGNRPLANANTVAPGILLKLLQSHPNPFQVVYKKGLTSHEKKRIRSGELDLLVSINSFSAARWLGPQVMKYRMVQMFVRGTALEVSLKDGFSIRHRLALTGMLAPIVQLYSQVGARSTTWTRLFPKDMGAMGRLRLNLNALSRMLRLIRAFGGARMVKQYNDQWIDLKQKSRKQGIDLPQLYSSMTGEILTGYLWNEDWAKRIAYKRLFKGNLEGVLAAVGFDTAENARKALKALHKVGSDLGKQYELVLPNVKNLTYTRETLHGMTVVKAWAKGLEPIFFVVRDRYLFVAGGWETFSALRKSWQSPSHSFATTVAGNKAMQKMLNGKTSQFYLIRPTVVRDILVLSKVGPRPVVLPEIAANLVNRAQLLSLSNESSGLNLRGLLKLSLSNKSTVTKAEKTTRAATAKKLKKWLQEARQGVPYVASKPVVAPRSRPVSRPSSQPTSRPTTARAVARALPPTAPTTTKKTARRLVPPADMFAAAGGIGLAHIAAVYIPLSALVGVVMPAFSRYSKRSRSSEAIFNIRRISTAAQSAFQRSSFTSAPPRFPCAGQGWICAPQAMPCRTGKPRYNADRSNWSHACWKALNFSIPGRHSYKYCIRSQGVGSAATFEITALGDLDCDGIRSVYQRKLMVTKKLRVIKAPISVQKPLE